MSLNRQSYKLPAELSGAVQSSIDDWKKNNKVSRLWEHDASLWTNDDEAKWLGWLKIVDDQLGEIATLKNIAADIKKAKFKHALLLGMGGSSLCPEVLRSDVRQDQGLPRAARSRFDRSRADQGASGEARSQEHDLHRLQQVGQHARAQHLQAVFLRADSQEGRRQGSRQSLHRHHRSRLEDAERRGRRSLP